MKRILTLEFAQIYSILNNLMILYYNFTDMRFTTFANLDYDNKTSFTGSESMTMSRENPIKVQIRIQYCLWELTKHASRDFFDSVSALRHNKEIDFFFKM